MNFETFENHAGTTDDDYFAFVDWLSEGTAEELRRAKADAPRQRQVLCRYFGRGLRAHLTPPELIDFLGVSTPTILETAGYNDEESDALMAMSGSLTAADIAEAVPDLADARNAA